MRKKDFNNTYSNKPENFSEHMNQSTCTYEKSREDWDEDIQIKNKDFTQINIKYLAELTELALTDSVARAIFDLFIIKMENNNTYIVTTAQLAEALHKSQRTIKRAIAILKERNFIVTYLKLKENMGAAYFINPQIACKCSASQKQFLTEKYLTLIGDKTYRASEDVVSMNALISKDRLVLRSDEKTQLDKLKRPDNNFIHGLIQIPKLLDGMSQLQIFEVLEYIKKLSNQGKKPEQEDTQPEESEELNPFEEPPSHDEQDPFGIEIEPLEIEEVKPEDFEIFEKHDEEEIVIPAGKGYMGNLTFFYNPDDLLGIFEEIAERERYIKDGLPTEDFSKIIVQGRFK